MTSDWLKLGHGHVFDSQAEGHQDSGQRPARVQVLGEGRRGLAAGPTHPAAVRRHEAGACTRRHLSGEGADAEDIRGFHTDLRVQILGYVLLRYSLACFAGDSDDVTRGTHRVDREHVSVERRHDGDVDVERNEGCRSVSPFHSPTFLVALPN